MPRWRASWRCIQCHRSAHSARSIQTFLSKNHHFFTKRILLKYFPARWIRPKVGSFHRTIWKEMSWGVFWKIRPSPIEWEPFNSRPPSRAIISHFSLNGQMRSKAHTALTAPLVLHHTRIYKCAMKKFGFNCQMRNEPFSIVIYHSSLVKALWMLSVFVNCAMVLNFGLSSTFHIFFASCECYQLEREQDVLGHDKSVHVSCYDDVLLPHELQLKRQQPGHHSQLKVDQ